jgi:hypothetical protein
MIKKIPCVSNDTLVLTLKIEETRLKVKQEEKIVEQVKLKTEETKLEQLKLVQPQTTITVNNNMNTFNININNFNELDNPKLTGKEARRLYADDMQKMIQNIFEHQYNSPNTPNNKCIKHVDKNKFLVKMNNEGKPMKFDELRSTLLGNYKMALDDILGEFYPTEFNARRYDCLSEKAADKYEDSVEYAHNIRNTGKVKKILQTAVSN